MTMNDYRINLNCWEPEATITTEGRKSYECYASAGGAVRWAKFVDDEGAKQAAREMWANHYPKTMKEVRIYNNEGKQIFEHNNFKEFV